MKAQFKFIYEDRKGNELKSEIHDCQTKKLAIKWANDVLANSMMNDLYKIKTQKVK